MKILVDYTIHNREVIEVEELKARCFDKDIIMDIHLAPLGKNMGYPIVKQECSILDIEAFEPLSD